MFGFQVPARTDVTVALPPKLELHCPAFVVANKSVDVTLVSWGGVGLNVNWTISQNDVQVAKGKRQILTHELCETNDDVQIIDPY